MISSILNNEFDAIAIFEHILPACDVIDLFRVHIKQTKLSQE
jgi:hypothetical protein